MTIRQMVLVEALNTMALGGGGRWQREGVGRGHSGRLDQVQWVLTNGQQQVRQNGQQHIGSDRVGKNNSNLPKDHHLC